jgi:hypothetical protein
MKNAYQGHIRKPHIPEPADARIAAFFSWLFVLIPVVAFVILN